MQANRDEAAGQLRRLAARRDETMRQRQAALAEAESLADAAAAATELGSFEAAAAEARQSLDRAEAERTRLATEEVAVASELRAAETTFARLAAEERALTEMHAAGPAEGSGALLDAVSVAAGYEPAFTALLGDDLLAPEDEQASARWRTLPPYADADAPPLPDGACPLAPSVRAPDALARRLRQIGIVDDVAEGERLQSALLPGQRLATRDGAVWRWDGFTRAAGAETPASLRLRQRARLDELRPLVMEAESACAAASERHTTARRAVAEAAAAQGRARAEQRAADQALARARQVLADMHSKRARIDARQTALAEALAMIDADHREAEARADALAAELAALPDGREEQRMLDELRADLSRLRSSQMERQARADTLVRDANGRARRLQAIEAEIGSWTERLDGMRRQIDAIVERQREMAEEMQRIETLPPALAERRRRLLEQSSAADAERRAAADRLLAAEAQLADADRSLRAAETALADAREDRVRADAQREQAEQTMHDVARTIADRLGGGPEKLAELVGVLAEDFDVADQERRLDRLRRERELMGPVNLRAEEEASDLEAQIAELDRQRVDLLEAIGKLRRGVAELDREGRERLRASFAEIDRHFQTLFCRLFGGGRAHLALTDSDDPLAAGLEIMASPPGKKLQLMSLLSGGEQTLTAVALRFAMFLTRPAPICVLDEVDAALDDANVDRFCSLLTELAGGGTRFLVITHHRLTMARMDRLFGVTMQEKGASRLVSVDLTRAEVLRQTG